MDGYYKRCQPLNKVNLSWVISEGRKGHEIQSMTLAQAISKEVLCHRFQSTAIQNLLAPKPWGHQLQKTQWLTTPPNTLNKPDLIISCGRKAAALAIHMKKQCGSPLIQILNPKGDLSPYDLLLLPKHDDTQPSNSCLFTGSIHGVRKRTTPDVKMLAIIIGNPHPSYWKNQWPIDYAGWKEKKAKMFVCGSPRLSPDAQRLIRSQVDSQNLWLDESDGTNPYPALVNEASEFAVTSDSINMINECMATGHPVQIIGQHDHLSTRHQRFLKSVLAHQNTSANWPQPLEEILHCSELQNLLNSPTSSKSG